MSFLNTEIELNRKPTSNPIYVGYYQVTMVAIRFMGRGVVGPFMLVHFPIFLAVFMDSSINISRKMYKTGG